MPNKKAQVPRAPAHGAATAAAGRQATRPTTRIVRDRTFIERYRGRLLLLIGAGVVVAVLAIVVLQAGSSSSTPTAAASNPADPALVAKLTQLPQSVYDAVGAGSVSTVPTVIGGAPLSDGDKPEVLYIGAEYCPYCAAERWAMLLALSRFGSFQDLKTTRSSPSDVFANTVTFSFYGSTYTSQYLSFDPVEQYTNQPIAGGGYQPLQSPTADQEQLLQKYDSGGGIPFIDFGGKYLVSGATYSPDLFSGKDWNQIADKLSQPDSDQAKAVIGNANVFTAVLCRLTNNQPGNVCQAQGTQRAGAKVR